MATTSVTSIASSGTGPLGIGSQVTFTLTPDNAVTVTGTPRLTLSNGATATYSGLVSGKPTFAYTVREGDTATSALTVTGLDTSNGTINGPSAAVTFAPRTEFAVARQPYGVAAADLNGDGFVDFVAGNNNGAASTVSVRFGDGTGNFTGSLELSAGTTTRGVAIADINGDGKRDILAANEGSKTVSLFLGDGLGNFSTKTDFVTTGSPVDVIAVDLNGDNKLDIVTANLSQSTLSVFLSNGSGGFNPATTLTAKYNRNVVAVDINGDGKLDLVSSNELNSGGLALFLNNGSGGFGAATSINVGGVYTDLAFGDMNGDGRADLVVAGSAQAKVLLADGQGGFTLKSTVSIGNTGTSISLVDFDGDGDLDVVTTGFSSSVAIRLNDGTGTLSGTTILSAPSSALTSTTADVNGDGRPDLLTANSNANSVSVFLNTSTAAAPFDATTVGSATGGDSGLAVDAVRPTAPTLALANDTGASATDTITSDAALLLGGQENGTTLSYVVNGGPAVGSFNPSFLSDGQYTVSVRQTDAAGNISSPATVSFTLDRTGTTVASVDVAGPGLTGGSGTLATGDTATITLTLSEAVDLSGSATSLTLSNGATAVFDANASTSTTLVFTYTVVLEEVSSDLAISSFNGGGTAILDKAGNAAQISIGDIPGTLVIDGYTGTAGNDAFLGAIGGQTFKGLAGDDTYNVDDPADVVDESGGSGTDMVRSGLISIDLSDSARFMGAIENATLTGSLDLTATGSGADNVLIGNEGENTLDGGTGADTLAGGNGGDTYVVDSLADVVDETGTDGIDTVQSSLVSISLRDTARFKGAIENVTLLGSASLNAVGNSLDNTLTGNAGNNVLNGGAGADTMVGGAGIDSYYVDNADDVVTELANQGTDSIYTTVNYTLSENVERIYANKAGLTIGGNVGTNSLYDFAGGSTAMEGGDGNDTYYVRSSGSTVTELEGQGTDTVYAEVGFTLGSDVENLTLTGSGSIDATGNGLRNVLIGNAGSNALDGLRGADTMIGGLGDDTYIVDDTGDVVTELAGGGSDTVLASVGYRLGAAAQVEVLRFSDASAATALSLVGNGFAQSLTGNAGNNVLNGLAGDDVLSGLAGIDSLYGSLGNDTLTGGAGNDSFVFTTALNAATNLDTVTDFANVLGNNDRILLDDAVMTKLASGALNGAFFVSNEEGTAQDADDFIVFNLSNGALSYDADGNGDDAAVQFATISNFASLTGKAALTAADFLVI